MFLSKLIQTKPVLSSHYRLYFDSSVCWVSFHFILPCSAHRLPCTHCLCPSTELSAGLSCATAHLHRFFMSCLCCTSSSLVPAESSATPINQSLDHNDLTSVSPIEISIYLYSHNYRCCRFLIFSQLLHCQSCQEQQPAVKNRRTRTWRSGVWFFVTFNLS